MRKIMSVLLAVVLLAASAGAFAVSITETVESGITLYEYALNQLSGTTLRGDYPELTDEQYANFRMITTPGIAPYTLYRSSSPVDPSLNRNREADEALNGAGIVSVLNLADTAEEMAAYESYRETYYSERNILPLALPTDLADESFHSGIAEAVRFIAESEGPWLIHCLYGKDRTGFLCAVLECLAGASAGEVIADYMETYVNLFHLPAEDIKYTVIAEGSIVPELEIVFGLEDLRADSVDLAAEAREYLYEIGLDQTEIDAVLEKLSE